MNVEKRKVTANISSKGTVIFDPNLLHSGYARKLYVFTNPDFKKRTEAHFHPAPHTISVIEGEDIRMATREPDGSISVIQLERGYYYYVPPNLPHQLDMEGPAIFETYMPSSSIISALQSDENCKKVLDEDFFELAKLQEEQRLKVNVA